MAGDSRWSGARSPTASGACARSRCTILCYSLFTFLAAFGQNIWVVAICRLLAGVGIGGEWAMGGTFVAEEWPEDRRKMGAGYMHTGYYFGFFLAALANHFVGENHGWRPMFMLGGAPAILIGLILYSVREPERWQARAAKVAQSLRRNLQCANIDAARCSIPPTC